MERISAANKMVVLKVVKEGHILGQTYQRTYGVIYIS